MGDDIFQEETKDIGKAKGEGKVFSTTFVKVVSSDGRL